MNNANQCPKCLKYIFGEYCFTCNIDIKDYKDIPDFLKGIFKGDKNG